MGVNWGNIQYYEKINELEDFQSTIFQNKFIINLGIQGTFTFQLDKR